MVHFLCLPGQPWPVRNLRQVIRHMLRVVALLVAGLTMPTSLPSFALAEEAIIEESTVLKVNIDGKPTELAVFIAKEGGAAKPLPIYVFTHGQFAKPEVRARMKATNFRKHLRDFARRGWLAVFVLRRGYGPSKVVGDSYKIPNCRNRDYEPTIDASTDDLEAAIKEIAKRPDADADVIVASGISAGSLAALNLVTRDIPGLKAVINFSGGILTEVKDGKKPGRKTCRKADLVKWFRNLDRKQQVPSLWLYAANDRLFSPDFVREMHSAFTAAGGDAELHQFGRVGKDGHYMAVEPDGILKWLPAVDWFFRKQGLSTYDVKQMEAALAKAKPSEKSKQVAQRYHGRSAEKALAISKSGSRIAVEFGADRIESAEQKALAACVRESGEVCRILWRNFEVMP